MTHDVERGNMAVKQPQAVIKLQVPAGEAKPSPPVGPALGQHGLNIMEFCKAFNAKTADMEKGMPIPVVINAYKDRSFNFTLKTPPTAFLLRKEVLGGGKGSATPHTQKVGKATREQLEKIAKIKEPDLTAASLEAAIRTVAGTAINMGIEVDLEELG